MVERFYFFTSTHYPQGSYNEIHPCRIVRTKWYERGRISFGLVSGYRNYRIPYIAYHWDGGFTLPVWMLSYMSGYNLYKIKCTYGDRTLKTSFKLVWNKWVK